MKSKDINIGGVIFHVEEKGYPLISTFMDRLYIYMEDDSDKLREIESMITESFLSILSESKFLIQKEEIDKVLNSMGIEYNEDKPQSLPLPLTKSNFPNGIYRQFALTKAYFFL